MGIVRASRNSTGLRQVYMTVHRNGLESMYGPDIFCSMCVRPFDVDTGATHTCIPLEMLDFEGLQGPDRELKLSTTKFHLCTASKEELNAVLDCAQQIIQIYQEYRIPVARNANNPETQNQIREDRKDEIKEARQQIESIIREHGILPARVKTVNSSVMAPAILVRNADITLFSYNIINARKRWRHVSAPILIVPEGEKLLLGLSAIYQFNMSTFRSSKELYISSINIHKSLEDTSILNFNILENNEHIDIDSVASRFRGTDCYEKRIGGYNCSIILGNHHDSEIHRKYEDHTRDKIQKVANELSLSVSRIRKIHIDTAIPSRP